MREFKYIPSFLSAETKEKLIQRMVERCVKDGLSYRFFDIQWDAQDKKWIAWFYPEKDDAKDVL